MSKRLVVSAVNFTEGGPLTVLRDCLKVASSCLAEEWEIFALVNNKLYFTDIPRVKFIEYPKAKHSWVRRLLLEFWSFNTVARNLKADVWLSLHDITPRVSVPLQVVYCHNPSPFYRPRLNDFWWEPRFVLFTLFYRYLYRINIKANKFVVVQQDWIRKAFKNMYPVKNIVVAHPITLSFSRIRSNYQEKFGVFFYPALPRVFKNFEVLCEAAILLRRKIGDVFEVRLTLSGQESRYAAFLRNRYGDIPVIKFIGRQNAEEMSRNYSEAMAVVFPSRVETWGLPISEAKSFGKRLIISDLPYAREAVGDYDKVFFFNPLDIQQLANAMFALLQNTLEFQPNAQAPIAEPFAENWEALLRMLVRESGNR